MTDAAFGLLIFGIVLGLLFALRRLIWRGKRKLITVAPNEPCPYCPNVDRWDNGNAVSGRLAGNCMYDSKGTGADAPCVCDSRWNHMNGGY